MKLKLIISSFLIASTLMASCLNQLSEGSSLGRTLGRVTTGAGLASSATSVSIYGLLHFSTTANIATIYGAGVTMGVTGVFGAVLLAGGATVLVTDHLYSQAEKRGAVAIAQAIAYVEAGVLETDSEFFRLSYDIANYFEERGEGYYSSMDIAQVIADSATSNNELCPYRNFSSNRRSKRYGELKRWLKRKM